MAEKQGNQCSDSMNPLYDISVHSSSTPDELQNMSYKNKLESYRNNDIDNQNDGKTEILGCPNVNCPEKIIICLDNSREMTNATFQSRTGDKYSPLVLIKRALGLFLHSKHRMNPNHEFALVWLKETAYWVCDFTSDPARILTIIDSCTDTFDSETCEMSSLFEAINQNVSMPVIRNTEKDAPPFIVRSLIIYGRSHCVLHSLNNDAFKQLSTSHYFFVDAYYIHEPVSENNKCEQIFDFLCNLDEKGLSYIFEVSRNPTKVYDRMAQLLAHPLQRPLQTALRNTIQTREEPLP